MAEDRILERIIRKTLDAYCLSKTIFEDYAKVVSKIENAPEGEVLDRINKRAQASWKVSEKTKISDTRTSKKETKVARSSGT